MIYLEKDDAERLHEISVNDDRPTQVRRLAVIDSREQGFWEGIIGFSRKVFLPSGYPASVTSDYTNYQIANALQAFCSSLASLLSSRAVLEGHGVGDANASATNALLLTVLQDFFSRITTIIGAYILGSSLYPEAKTYRLLADILNDLAVIIDTMTPLFVLTGIPSARAASLCLSGSLRSLCGIAAGGSKASITNHFASPKGGMGDVGDLNAKDASKETVLALMGMLLGTLVVPYLTTPAATYSVLMALVALHIGINYRGVKGLALRTLNRQRVTLLWTSYRKSLVDRNSRCPTPEEIAWIEPILSSPGTLRDGPSRRRLGHCTIGASIRSPQLEILSDHDAYIILRDPSRNLHIALKEEWTAVDTLQAWITAVEIACLEKGFTAVNVEQEFQGFMELLEKAGWIVDGGIQIVAGTPRWVLLRSEKKES